MGERALSAISGGYDNTAIGYTTLLSLTTGRDNTAVGSEALSASVGDTNTAVGAHAGQDVTTGRDNTALGGHALFRGRTGSGNTAVGAWAAYSVGQQQNNETAVGSTALANGSSGGGNTFVGSEAGRDYNGRNNTAIGGRAFRFGAPGAFNIAVGYEAGINRATGDYNIYIGNAGNAGDANAIRLGTPGNHSRAFIAGIAGTMLTTPADPIYISADGQLGTLASSRRYKDGIRDLGDASAALYRLRPVTYHYKADTQAVLQYGLIAEEVAEVLPQLVITKPDGTPETVRYQLLVPMLLNELQRQHSQLQEMQREIAILKASQPDRR